MSGGSWIGSLIGWFTATMFAVLITRHFDLHLATSFLVAFILGAAFVAAGILLGMVK